MGKKGEKRQYGREWGVEKKEKNWNVGPISFVVGIEEIFRG